MKSGQKLYYRTYFYQTRSKQENKTPVSVHINLEH